MGIVLTKGQDKAIKKAKKWYLTSSEQVFKIQGWGGTGKTTIVFALINELNISLNDVLFVTYVGKATIPLRHNGLLAKTIHATTQELLQPENDRPVKRSGSSIYLLHHLQCPAVLVECGFLSNPEEAALLADEAYRQQLALTLCMGILRAIL